MIVPDDSTSATLCDPPLGFPVVPLADVDIREQLDDRPRRSTDYRREHHALSLLAAEMAENPRNMLQKLVEVALDLCGAHTAGVSVLDGEMLRWEALAGVFAFARGRTMLRNASPCGVCVDRDATQLMHLPDRCFPALFAEPRFVEALLVPLHDHGTPVGVVWVVSHSAERQFDREDERFIRVLAEFASAGRQLWIACDAADDANRQHIGVLGMLGHELRNRLAALTTSTAILQRHVGSQDPSVHALSVMARQTQYIARLADDLLNVGRISSGKMRLQVTPLNLCALVTEVVEMCRPTIEQKGLRMAVRLGDVAVWVNGDPMRLTQVFSNLLDNAAKYTPTDGRIAIDAISDDHEVSILISDSGIGIPANQLRRIFEPFAQFGTLSDSGGLGLGLSLVQSLAILHGGVVTVSSDGPGHGSCFTVRLPVVAPPDGPSGTAPPHVENSTD